MEIIQSVKINDKFFTASEACEGPMAAYGDINASVFFSEPGAYCSKPVLEENNGTYLAVAGNCSQFLTSIESYEACPSQERILYDDFEFEATIATEFDLVCDQQYKVTQWFSSLNNLLLFKKLFQIRLPFLEPYISSVY